MVHKDSGGVVVTTDVCKTPVGSTVVPIPYVNVARSEDTESGSKTVKVDGNPIMLKGSYFGKSYGDEAGTAGGVGSGVIRGKAKFVNYSFDVFGEGRPVCRRLDPMVSNIGGSANTPPAPVMQENAAGSEADGDGHLLPVAFVFKQPDLTTERRGQPVFHTAHTVSGPETLRNEPEEYAGVLHRPAQEGEFVLEFDQFVKQGAKR